LGGSSATLLGTSLGGGGSSFFGSFSLGASASTPTGRAAPAQGAAVAATSGTTPSAASAFRRMPSTLAALASLGPSTVSLTVPSTPTAPIAPAALAFAAPAAALRRSTLHPAVEAELLIRAYYCFALVSHAGGLDRVLRLIRERAEVYALDGRFGLIARLLFATRQYRELPSLLDALARHDKLDLMLRSKPNIGEDTSPELRTALYEYLQRTRATDLERLLRVCRHFQMYREIADTLKELAGRRLRALRDRQGPAGPPPPPAVTDELLAILSMYVEAADNYLRADCAAPYQRMLAISHVVALQLQLPTARLLNLGEAEVRRLMATLPSYSDARLVAEAYERSQPAEWVNAVYTQAVLNGNLAFAEHHALVGRPPGSFYIELVSRYKADAAAQARGTAVLTNLRRTLETCPDPVVQYRLADSLKMADLMEALAANISGIHELAVS